MARNLVQWQAFIGPIFKPAEVPYAWDWTAAADLNLASAAGSLTNRMEPTDTGIAAVSGIALPPAGGAWIGPNGTGEGWEYVHCTYAGGQILLMQREDPATYDHNGVHSAGAAVKLWAPLDTNDGTIHIVRETDETLSVSTWSAELAGVAAPKAFLRRHHAIYIRERASHSAAWSPFLLGWIDQFSIDDDFSRVARWKLRIVSIAGMLSRIPSAPLRSDELDIARSGKIIKEDIPLASPHKERASGDYDTAWPDLTAKSAIDGDDSTPWITERILGTPGKLVQGDQVKNWFGLLFIAKANLTIPPGLGKGYRWLQVQPTDGDTLGDVILCNKTGPLTGVLDLRGTIGVDSRMFLVENLNLFTADNPITDPTRIREIGSAPFDAIDLAGDSLALWGGLHIIGWLGKAIKWGNIQANQRPWYENDEGRHLADHIIGDPIPAPATGQIIRYYHNPNATQPKDQFKVDNYDPAGYEPGETRPYPFFLLALPGMGLQLKADLGSSYTGTLELWDGTTTHTQGLDSAGTIQIGDEQISYNTRTATTIRLTARGANGTTAALHKAGDPIAIVDNGQATEALQIKSITWKARAGGIHPKDFHIRGSRQLVQPRYPVYDDENFNADYENDYIDLSGAITNWGSSSYTLNLSPSQRISWILFEVLHVSVDPGRARIDTLSAILDTSLLNSDQWLPASSTLNDILLRLFTNGGVPAAALTLQANLCTGEPFEITTAHGNLWQIITDLADYTSTYVDISLLSHITVRDNTLWRTDLSQTATRTWTRSNTAAVQIMAEPTTPTAQVQMTLLNADGTEDATLVYPSRMDYMGDVKKLKSAIYPSQALALAAMQRRYIIAKYPYSIGLQTALGEDALAPGEMNEVSWDFHDGTTTRTGLVRDVEHVIEKMTWKTTTRIVLIREAY